MSATVGVAAAGGGRSRRGLFSALDSAAFAVARSTRWHLPLVLVACALIYWPLLAGPGRGLRSSEGLRTVPGWTIVRTGEWFPTRMYDAAYLRKPPGMPWAVAVSSSVLGENEFAARAVSALSATAMAAAAFVAARRWFGASGFGSAAGLASGLTQALLPRMWTCGRTAEIEALLCVATQAGAFFLVDVLVFRRGQRGVGVWAGVVGAAASLFASLMVKGPAGVPVVAGVAAGACVVNGSWRTLLSPRLLVPLAAAGAGFGVLYLVWARSASAEPVETEAVSHFLWSAERLAGIATFGAEVIMHGAPASVWLLTAWALARTERSGSDASRVSRALAWGFLLSLAVGTMAGLSNPRYGVPAMGLLPPLAGFAAAGCLAGVTGGLDGFDRGFRRVCRVLSAGSPVSVVAVLLVGVAVYLAVIEPPKAARTTQGDGEAVGRLVEHDAEVWASGMVNAKPELLYYAQREAAGRGIALHPRWLSGPVAAAQVPSAGTYLVLTDEEAAKYEQSGAPVRTVSGGVADKQPYRLLVVEADGGLR